MAITLESALARFDRLAGYGGIVRGRWQGKDQRGREIACRLGALDPSIEDPLQCPGELMPSWIAYMIPGIAS